MTGILCRRLAVRNPRYGTAALRRRVTSHTRPRRSRSRIVRQVTSISHQCLPRGANCILCDLAHSMMSWALVIRCPCFTALMQADVESISGVSGRGYSHRIDGHAHSSMSSVRHRRGYLRYRCRSHRQQDSAGTGDRQCGRKVQYKLGLPIRGVPPSDSFVHDKRCCGTAAQHEL